MARPAAGKSFLQRQGEDRIAVRSSFCDGAPVFREGIETLARDDRRGRRSLDSWPKKSSGVGTDVTEDVIREVCLPLGFVDVKVCAVDETWSGLKLMIRRENRK